MTMIRLLLQLATGSEHSCHFRHMCYFVKACMLACVRLHHSMMRSGSRYRPVDPDMLVGALQFMFRQLVNSFYYVGPGYRTLFLPACMLWHMSFQISTGSYCSLHCTAW